MDFETRHFRQLQRDYGNPYKEGSRQWLAWANGYDAGRIDVAMQAFAVKVKMADLPRKKPRTIIE